MACWEAGAPLNLQPRPGQQWAAVSGKNKEPGRAPRRRLRATYTRIAGVRHLLAAYELGDDKPVGGRSSFPGHAARTRCRRRERDGTGWTAIVM
jgi:hypothetical protein